MQRRNLIEEELSHYQYLIYCISVKGIFELIPKVESGFAAKLSNIAVPLLQAVVEFHC